MVEYKDPINGASIYVQEKDVERFENMGYKRVQTDKATVEEKPKRATTRKK